MKILKSLCLLIFLGMLSSCKDYLDVVPDNLATVDNAFANRSEAEKYLFTCYSYLPWEGDYVAPQFMAAGELWLPDLRGGANDYGLEIGKGNQNVVNPYMNFWDGANGQTGGYSLFRGIRDCNIFLENIDKPFDLDSYEKSRWIAEVKFLKAYYHFFLLRMYGPVPIVDKNLPIDASTEDVRRSRQPIDKTVNYIASLLDEAAAGLPDKILSSSTELGRITKPIALSIKARLLVMAASPLFNGNPDYANFKGRDGVVFFNPTNDASKWDRASVACKEAIDACDLAGISLYEFPVSLAKISDSTRVQMSIRGSVSEKWNSELIWGSVDNRATTIQQFAMARIDPANPANFGVKGEIAPTMRVAETYYSRNGVPITEDASWDYSGRYNLREATRAERFNLIEGYTTASLNFDREPRFYASLGFDGSVWYMQNSPSGTDENTWNVKAKIGQTSAQNSIRYFSPTGYFAKKLVNWKFVIGQGQAVTLEAYPWPVMRLADLYLLYSEALNEVKNAPDAETYKWIDLVRQRAKLGGVVSSWTNYSTVPGKPLTKTGLRKIIHQERQIELAMEGQPYWDLKRWKEANQVINGPVRGWTIKEKDAVAYYRPQVLFNQVFVAPRDYFFPIKESDLTVNPNLVQNPGW